MRRMCATRIRRLQSIDAQPFSLCGFSVCSCRCCVCEWSRCQSNSLLMFDVHANRFSVRASSAVLLWPHSVHLVFGRVALQLSLLILAAEFRGDCAIDRLLSCYGCTLGTGTGIRVISLSYKRYCRHPTSLECQSEHQTAHGTRRTP